MPTPTKDDISKELEDVKIDGEDSDDYFEKILETEMEDPKNEEEAGSDASDKDDNVADSSKGTDDDSEPTYAELKNQLQESQNKIAILEKESKGRLSDTVKSRQDKAQMKAELDELKTAVTSMLDKRNNARDAEPETDDKPIDLSRKDIAFDDDDKAFVDLSDVDKKIEAATKAVQEDHDATKKELEQLKNDRLAEQAKKDFQDNVNTILGENEDAFQPAWEDLKLAYKDLNDAVISLQTRLDIMDEDGTIDQDQAIDLLQGSEELKNFTEKHPGIDPIKVARAFNSKVDFRNSLRDIADIKSYGKKDKGEIDEVIKKAKHKPGSLSGTENQAGGKVDLIDRIAELDTSDIFNMGDAEVAKIEAMLERQELEGD